ncbi:c-type heme family protein [Muricoccus radiodurans]|uniref:c-type heme family protein n=1 Tax=Muricoccus radiodurans TaxID=2231721 RepID=UPI003CFB0298
MSLRIKFNLVMVAAFLVGIGLAALFTKTIAEDTARRQVLHEASLLMHQATAVRGYTSGEVAPLLADQNAVRFLPHTVPSWAAQTVLRTVGRNFPDYDYKEAALNPTNPADRATDWESDIINTFRRDAALTEHVGQRATPNGPVLTFSRPFRITDRACLTCHSTPAVAPASMVDLYGPSNGFGWQLNEVIGAQIVSVPMSVPLERAQSQLVLLLASLAAVFLVMLLLLNLLLHFVVIRPIQQMTAAAERAAGGDLDTPEFTAEGRDEISSLARSFNLMRRSLVNAMKLLEA